MEFGDDDTDVDVIGLDLRSLLSGLIGIALGDDSAQMVENFFSLACRVVKGASARQNWRSVFVESHASCMIANEGIFCWFRHRALTTSQFIEENPESPSVPILCEGGHSWQGALTTRCDRACLSRWTLRLAHVGVYKCVACPGGSYHYFSSCWCSGR